MPARSTGLSELDSSLRFDAARQRVLDRLNFGDEVRHLHQLRWSATSGQHQVQLSRLGAHQAKQLLERYQASFYGAEDFVEDDHVVFAFTHDLLRASRGDRASPTAGGGGAAVAVAGGVDGEHAAMKPRHVAVIATSSDFTSSAPCRASSESWRAG